MIATALIAHGIVSFITAACLYPEHRCGYQPSWLMAIWLMCFNWFTWLVLAVFLGGYFHAGDSP